MLQMNMLILAEQPSPNFDIEEDMMGGKRRKRRRRREKVRKIRKGVKNQEKPASTSVVVKIYNKTS